MSVYLCSIVKFSPSSQKISVVQNRQSIDYSLQKVRDKYRLIEIDESIEDDYIQILLYQQRELVKIGPPRVLYKLTLSLTPSNESWIKSNVEWIDK